MSGARFKSLSSRCGKKTPSLSDGDFKTSVKSRLSRGWRFPLAQSARSGKRATDKALELELEGELNQARVVHRVVDHSET